jgi:hypothetical protein
LGFHQLDTSKLAKSYKANPSSLSNSYWDTIINYLDAVYETNKDLFVVLVENAPDDTESDESPERFTYLKSLLDSKYPYSNLKDFRRCDGFWSSNSVVLIDLISNNDKITEYENEISKFLGDEYVSFKKHIENWLEEQYCIN